MRCIASALRSVLFLLAAMAFGLPQAYAQISFEAEIGRVVDGDSVVLVVGEISYRARLHGIDAPESDQPWGAESTAVLRELLRDGMVRVVAPDIDRYGRLIVRLYHHGLFINEEMVRRGAAWRYPQFDPENEFGEAEEGARSQQLGLWAASRSSEAEGRPISPWEWRRGRRD